MQDSSETAQDGQDARAPHVQHDGMLIWQTDVVRGDENLLKMTHTSITWTEGFEYLPMNSMRRELHTMTQKQIFINKLLKCNLNFGT